MPVRVHNLVPDFLAFWEAAQNSSLEEQKRLWLELYENPHRAFFDIYYSLWGSPARLDRALAQFPAIISSVQKADPERSIKEGVATCARLLQMPEPDFEYIAMVALFTSNGWATTYQGRTVSFLALEYFTEQRYFDVLVTHEAAHSFHALARKGDWSEEYQIGQALFEEGLATTVSAVACPNLTELEYLWFGPGYEAWLTECQRRSDELLTSLRATIDCADVTTYGRFFMGPGETFPARSGYLVGYRLVRQLNRQYSVAEMVRWSREEAVARVTEALAHLDHL
jgi:hypothetical protein